MVLGASAAVLPAQQIKVVLVGDSTVNDEGGWGTGFRASLDSGVQVVNLALNGRSTKSFRDEGHWAPALAEKADYILIQFGHNDVPGKGADRETDAATSYRDNLARYIGEARAAGAQPILVTSIVRRVFGPDGTFKPDSLVPYAAAARAVAAGLNVPVMDLYELTRRQTERLGPAGSAKLNAVTKDDKPDTTHLGPEGRKLIGILAAREFVRVVPSAASHLIDSAEAAQ